MKKRQWAIIAGLVVLGVALLLFNLLSNTPQEKKPEKKIPVKGVETFTIKNGPVPVRITMDGKLRAQEKIALYAEVNGILQPGGKKFEEGIAYNKGETLLRLENSEARANYLAAKSEFVNVITQSLPDIKIDYSDSYETWRNYLNEISKEGHVSTLPQVQNDQLRLFLTGRGVYSNYQSLQSARVRLSKFEIVAPFSGVVTEANVETGTLVRAGQRLGEFIKPGQYELETTISSNNLELIEIGDSVSLGSPDMEGQWTGYVFRTNAKVDPATQRVKIFIRVKGKELKDGMFMNALIEGRAVANAFRLERKLIYEGSYTYVVVDSTLQKRPLKIIKKSPNTVIARGLPDGTLVPNQPIPGAFDGMEVKLVNGQADNSNESQNPPS